MPDLRTDTQRVSDNIKNKILSGEISLGTKLPQRKLADRFHTTPIVVREALRILENSGLVIIEPKWGAMVIEITPEQLWGRYIVREALEGMSARLASKIINDKDKDVLLDLAANCDRDLLSDAITPFDKSKIHYRLHEEIAILSACEPLISALRRLNLQLIIFSNAYHINWHEESLGWHTKLIKDLLTANPDIAEATMREHVRKGYQMELGALERHKRDNHID